MLTNLPDRDLLRRLPAAWSAHAWRPARTCWRNAPRSIAGRKCGNGRGSAGADQDAGGLYADVEAFIRGQHPYEVPEIIAVTVQHGLGAYLQWVADETRFAAPRGTQRKS